MYNKFCPVCKTLDPRFFKEDAQKDPFLHIDRNCLQSRSAECLSCALLLKILQRYFRKFMMSTKRVKMVYRCENIVLEFGTIKEVYLYSTERTPWRSIKIQRHVTGSTFSKQSLAFVKEMLDKCNAEHEICRPKRDAPLPTRLLDLGSEEDRDCTNGVRLWETKDVQASQSVRYACLSHCWGETQPIRTTPDTFAKHKKKIPLGDLPRTFADAVDFTRKMGVRYLWIDSLCIIQDNEEDWTREAARMCDVYENCEFCLAAPGSSGHGSGLYSISSVPTERFSSSSFSMHGSDHPPWELYGREPLYTSHHLLKDPDTITVHDPERGPNALRFRGWVYQERMLAPRTIQFLGQELSWDCRKETLCECGTAGHDVDSEATMGHKKIKFVSEHHSRFPGKSAARWRGMVKSYTSLYLTKESDRLPAIAGITRAFEEVRGPQSTCHAGIWTDTAAHDLSWRVFDLHSQKKTWVKGRSRTRIPGVPTWSWASVYASVHYYEGVGYYNKTFESLCSTIEMEPPRLLSVDTNHTQPQTQHLVIRGQLLPAVLVYLQEVYLEDRKDAEEQLRYSYALRFRGYDRTWRFHEDDDLRLPGTDHVPHETSVFCLALGRYRIARTHVPPTVRAVGSLDQFDRYDSLVLQVVNASKNTYRRIGILNIGRETWPQTVEQRTVRIC